MSQYFPFRRIRIALVLPLIWLSGFGGIWAQEARLVYFRDKANSPYQAQPPNAFLSEKALARRTRQHIPITPHDWPTNPAYTAQIRALGAEVRYTSRWLNAAMVIATPEQFAQIAALPFVKQADPQAGSIGASRIAQYQKWQETQENEPLAYGNSFYQNSLLEIDLMHQAGYTGKGISVAVLDAGFQNVQNLPFFDHLFANNHILGTYDFVDQEEDVFDDHRHGMQVLSVLAGYAPNQLIGPAYEADFWLFRTETVSSETKFEEFYWLLGAEMADSAGADAIVASLGYFNFDQPIDRYEWADLDGDTPLVTWAADRAAAVGMLVVVSAGNEGSRDWERVTPPADADSVLTVGAVNSFGGRVGFSSVGPTADGRLKPDVMAMGLGTVVGQVNGSITSNSGTSFACPALAGLAIGLWQAFPQLTNWQLIEFLRASGDRAHAPDALYGYGVPTFSRFQALANDNGSRSVNVFPNPATDQLWIEKKWDIREEELSYQLMDATGKTWVSGQLPAQLRIERVEIPPYLPSGLYLIRIQRPSGPETRKVWITR